MSASNHPEEARRLAALHALNILDTDPEERFDRITRLAQRIFDAPISAVTLVDRERVWFKSAQGMDGKTEDPREISFCPHAVLEPETTMVVEDAMLDERFIDNPLVATEGGIRFYAGHPIVAPGGEPLGALCVVDDKPRVGAAFDEEALRELAAMAEAEVSALSLAIGDELTGLANRRGFEMLGERLLAAADRLGLTATAVYADLDRMKPINDEHGHEAGDRAIRETAAVLAAALRSSDLVARLGGDEFCALLVGRGEGAGEAAVARVEQELATRNAESDAPYGAISISLGFAETAEGATPDLPDLVDRADRAMFEAKRKKRAAR